MEINQQQQRQWQRQQDEQKTSTEKQQKKKRKRGKKSLFKLFIYSLTTATDKTTVFSHKYTHSCHSGDCRLWQMANRNSHCVFGRLAGTDNQTPRNNITHNNWCIRR